MTPGPDHYKKETYFKNAGPKFVIGIKTNSKLSKKKTVPGPGSYNIRESIDFSASKKTAPRCAFGREKRQGIQIKIGPAPN